MQKISITSLDHLENVVQLLDSSERFVSIDLETSGLDYLDSEVIGVALAAEGATWYIDFLTWKEEAGDNWMRMRTWIWRLLLPILDLRKHVLIAHNAPFDLFFIRRELQYALGTDEVFAPCAHFWDTLQMAALNNENLIGVSIMLPEADGTERSVGALSLKALSRIYLDRAQRLWDASFLDWTPEERLDYACDDARNTYDLAILFSNELTKKGLMDYYERLVSPQVFVAEHMERVGIHVDVPALEAARAELNTRIAALEETMRAIVPPNKSYKYALREPWTKAKFIELTEAKLWGLPTTKTGKPSVTAEVLEQLATQYPTEWEWDAVRVSVEEPFNFRSRKQLGDYLVSLGCRLPITATGQPSTAEETLAEAAERHPDLEIWKPLFEIQKLEKMRNTYIDGVLEVVWPEDQTVHPEWNVSGTTSGRYSCTTSDRNKQLAHKRGPALQTIPNPERLDEELWDFNPRSWYIPSEGCTFVIADLAQAEVRMLAAQSQDRLLMHALEAGGDIHAENAKTLWPNGWDRADDVERKSLRTKAKQGTFAVLYGGGPPTLAKNLHISIEEAQEFLSQFYDTFLGVGRWKRSTERGVLSRGYSTTLLGRRRTPVLIAIPPRVTTTPREDPDRFRQETLRLRLWQACWDVAIQKGRLDPQNATKQELEGRSMRQCVNHCIQGSVGEVINNAAWRLVRAGYNLVLQMHDELVVEVEDQPEKIAEVAAALKTLLDVEIQGVSFVCDITTGSSWAAGKEKK